MTRIPVSLIADHVATGERMLNELLIVCPAPQAADFDSREQEYRTNIAARVALADAMETIAACMHKRRIQSEQDDGTKSSMPEAMRLGVTIGEEVAAKRFIATFVRAFNG